MDEDFVQRLNALLVKWDLMTEAGMRRVNEEASVSVAGFYHGAVYGIDRAREDLAALLVEMMQTKAAKEGRRPMMQ
jgi:hypothetical protein